MDSDNIQLDNFTERIKKMIDSGDINSAIDAILELNTENMIIFLRNFIDDELLVYVDNLDNLWEQLLEYSKLDLTINDKYSFWNKMVILRKSIEKTLKEDYSLYRIIDIYEYMAYRNYKLIKNFRTIKSINKIIIVDNIIKNILNDIETSLAFFEVEIQFGMLEFDMVSLFIEESTNEISHDWDDLLDNILENSTGNEVTNDDYIENGSSSFTLIGLDQLTPDLICTHIVPYINGLRDLQRVISLIENKPFVEPHVLSITQNSPISIDFSGIADAIAMLRDEIVPWRKKYNKNIAKLNQEKAKLEVVKQRVEVATDKIRHESLADNYDLEQQLELEKKLLEIRKMKAEVEAIEIENERKRSKIVIELSHDIMEKKYPSMPLEDKMKYMRMLIKGLIEPATSILELETEDDENIKDE